MKYKFLLAITLLLSVFKANATKYYVNKTVSAGDIYTIAAGNNANAGTPAAPFLTLGKALSVATAGDTIYVDADTYNSSSGSGITKEGGYTVAASQDGIKIIGAGITATVFDGTNYMSSTAISNFYWLNITGNNVVIQNMTLKKYFKQGAIDITASAAASDSSRTYITNVFFDNNESDNTYDGVNNQGGAVWISASTKPAAVYFTNSHFNQNIAETGAGGGAIFAKASGTVASTIILEGCRLTCNSTTGVDLTTYDGGAILLNNAAAKINNSFFSGNRVNDRKGGAIYSNNTLAGYLPLTITNTIFASNRGRQGVAVFADGKSTCTITNSLFYGNLTTSGFGNGGTISCDGTTNMSILNSTIANNTSSGSDGSGLAVEAASSYSVLNSIIYGNQVGNVSSATINATYCDIENVGDLHSGVTGNINTNPLFTSAADFTLQGTSPAINTGTSAGAPARDLTNTIRSGNPDMGCFESGSTFPTVSNTCGLFLTCATPSITSIAASPNVCSGSTFTSSLVSSPIGATFNWISNDVSGISGHSNSGIGNINETLTNSGSTSLNVTYTITPTLGSCVGSSTIYTVTVVPAPTMSSATTKTICSGNSVNLALTSAIASNYSWLAIDNTNTSGESTSAQTGATINDVLTNTTTATEIVSYTVTPTSTVGNCIGTSQTVNITVTPAPTITSASTKSICSGDAVGLALTSSIASSYSWIGTDNTNTSGESTSAQNSSTINDVLTNTTTVSEIVSYTVTPTSTSGSCIGGAQTVSVTVNPKPTMTNGTTTSVCSGIALNFGLTSNVGASYSWIAGDNSNTSGESTSAQSSSTINNTITNNTSSAQLVTYTITPTSTIGSCIGSNQTLTVTVNAIPTVSSSNTTSVCSGTALNFGLTANPTSNFTWIATDNTNTTGESTTTQLSNTINNSIINASNSVSENIVYTVTPTSTAGNCLGAAQTLTVTVNPTPVITSSNSTSVCSGTTLNYNLTSSTTSSITWIAADNSNTTGESTTSQTSSTINNTINNNTTSSETVVYTVTPTSTTGTCLGTAQTLSVTVNPTPTVTSNNNASICSGTALNLNITSNVPSSFTWIASDNANTNGESTSTQNTSLINDNIIHSQATAQDVFYTITPTATIGNCLGSAQTLTVTVNPTPIVDALSNPAANCAGQTVNAFTFTTNPTGATVNWINNNTNTGLAASGIGSPINGFIANNVATQEISVISLTPTLGTCTGATSSYTLTINPNPTLAIGALDVLNPSACGNNDGHITGLLVSGAPTIQYSWNSGTYTSLDLTNLNAGTYNLVATDGNGCTVDTSLTLSDPSAPNAPAFTITNDTVCDGGSTTLNIVNPDVNTTYNWIGPLGPIGTGTSITISPATEINEGIYNASATLAGCTGNLSLNPVSLIVNENPTVLLTPNSNSFCEDANLVLTANLTNPGGTATIPSNGYQWLLNSNPISGANASTYTTNQAGTYELIVTNSNNCSSTNASLAVTLNLEPSISLSSALIDSADCSGTNGSISNININSGTPDYTFNWFNASNNLLSSTLSSTTSVTPLTNIGAGNYTLIVIDSKGCNDTVSVNLNNFSTPTTPIIASNPSNCSGTTLNPISVTGTGGTFNWYGDIALTNLVGNGSPFTPNFTSTDTLYITQSIHNCESPGTEVIVTINTTPNAPTALGASYCQGQAIQDLTASGGTGTINWYSDNTLGTLIGTGSQINSGITSTDTVYVNETSLGCTSFSTEVIITVNALPALPIVTANGPLTFCDGNSVTLTANPSTGITWSPGGSTNASITVTTNGSFAVTYTDNNNCSSTSANTDVIVNTNPTAPILSLSSGSASFCAGDSATISATPNTGLTWSNGANAGSIVVTSTGNFTAFITDANNCISPTASISIVVNANPQINNSFVIDTAYCNSANGGIYNLNVTGGTSPYAYQWISNNNVIGTDSILNNVLSGSYTYVVVDQNGCSDTSSNINVPSGNGVDINLVSDLYQGYEPSNANLTSNVITGNPINYIWYLNNTVIGGQNTSTLTLNSLTQGTYITSIVANDVNGCYDSVSVTIIIESQIKIIIPNVFTPNGDGTNDAFTITAEGLKDIEIVIYDRWGLLMYSQKAEVLSWDGKLPNGELASDGTYYFLFTGKDIKDNVIEKQGYVTLIK